MGARLGRGHRGRASAILIAVLTMSGIPLAAAQPAHAVVACPGGFACLTAIDDAYTMNFSVAGTSLNVAAPGLLTNDFGPSNTTVDVVDSDTTSWFGGATVSVHANGSFSYRPDPLNPFTGDDTFDYWIQDTNGNQDFATATITVNPVVRDDAYYTHTNTTLDVAAPGVFANDLGLDPAGALWDSDDTSAQGGSVTVNADGSFSYVPPNGFSGVDTFHYIASDINGDNTFPATVTVNVDSTPPTVVMTAPATAVLLSTTVHAAWVGADSSGIANYDVQMRHAAWNGSFAGWTNWKLATTATSANLAGNIGQSYCFRARATDRAGNVSGFSAERCTTVPLKASNLTYAGVWGTQARTDVFGGVIYYSSTKHAQAKRVSTRAKQVYIVVTKCSSCGTLQVRWNNVVTANVNLAYAKTVRRQVVRVASFPAISAGTLTLTVTSPTGKAVIIESVATYKD